MGKSFSIKNIFAASALIITLVLLMPFYAAHAKTVEIPQGASFELISDIGFEGSRFYLYSPSHPNLDFDMSRMLNSVVFVYPDKPYDTKEKADMPFIMIPGTADSANFTTDEKGNKAVSGGGPFKGGLKLLMEISMFSHFHAR